MRVVFVAMMMSVSLFASSTMIKSLVDNVLLKNTQLAIKGTQEVASELNEQKVDITKVREKFSHLVYGWKKVEATYVGGELDSDYLDLPRYIDMYHEGNENIHEQLARVIKSKDSLDVELFKNSYKTINALEFILYQNDNLSPREVEIAKRINTNIQSRLEEILSAYKENTQKLISDESFANGAILNALISSSYKAAMWRVAEGIGESRKYKNVDKRRFEYSFSKLSANALSAIVKAHQEIMDGDYDDFGDMALKNGAKDEVNTIRPLLKKTLTLVEGMGEDDLVGKKGKELYENLKQLYLSYALYMVDALSVTAKIVEADGD